MDVFGKAEQLITRSERRIFKEIRRHVDSNGDRKGKHGKYPQHCIRINRPFFACRYKRSLDYIGLRQLDFNRNRRGEQTT